MFARVRSPRVVFLVTEDWYFLSHRLQLAKALKEKGADVIVVTAAGEKTEEILSYGFQHRSVPFVRKSINVFTEFATLKAIARLYKEITYLVHHVALKPIIDGSLAAKWTGVPASVNTVPGLGYVFTASGAKPRMLRWLLKKLLRLSLNNQNSKTILQNPDDHDLFCRLGLIQPVRAQVILGSGVDTEKFLTPDSDDGDECIIARETYLGEGNRGIRRRKSASSGARSAHTNGAHRILRFR